MKVIVKYQLIVLFGVMLVLPMLNSSFKFVTFDRPNENRVYRDSLEFDINKLDNFPSECEEYFNDNFSFRTPLLGAYHHLKYNYFNVSPYPDKTIIGKDNWYFLAGDELDDYQGRRQLTQNQLDRIKQEWLKRKTYFDKKGIKFYWMIAPAKHEVYEDQLPFYAVKSNRKSRTDQVIEYLKTDFPDFIVDPREELKQVRSKMNTFYHLDNHWSYFGAYVAANQLMKKIEKEFPNDETVLPRKYDWEKQRVQWGIHYNTLGIDDISAEEFLPNMKNDQAKKADKYGFAQPHEYNYDWEFEERYRNENSKSKLRILVIRDSYGDNLLPFIKECFSESVFIFDYWEYKLNPEIIDVVQPDIVVYENISKFLQVFAGDDKYKD